VYLEPLEPREQQAQTALLVQPEQLVSLAYPAQRALLASAQQARWACLVPPELQELQALTVQQEPPASLVSQVPLVLPESSVFQERQAPPESRAVMVLQAQQGLLVSLVRLA
jgi:hypothetical protein